MSNIFRRPKPLHPDFPVVEGRYQMTPDWAITLPMPFNRRFEEKQLVLWRPGITAWVTVWGNDKNETTEARLSSLNQGRSSDVFSENKTQHSGVTYYSFRLNESSEDNRVAAFYCQVFSDTGHVQMSVYFDKESDLAMAESLCYSLKHEAEKP